MRFQVGDRVKIRTSCWEGKGAGLWGYVRGYTSGGKDYYIDFDGNAGERNIQSDGEKKPFPLKDLQFYEDELELGFEAAVKEALELQDVVVKNNSTPTP